jgi:hypothetical protein
VIRNLILAPLSGVLRRWSRVGGATLEGSLEYLLFFIGWLLWPLDWLVRLPLLARDHTVGGSPRQITVRGTPLLRAAADADAASARARAVLAEAGALLAPLGIRFDVESVEPVRLPEDVRIPACGFAIFASRFFSWASARAAAAPQLTVYFVEDLGPLAGCAVPGSDWLVADLNTDGTTVAHELGHLAGLWRHHADPDNVMTDRAGGSHDRVTPAQTVFLRTSRFSVPVSARRRWPGGS